MSNGNILQALSPFSSRRSAQTGNAGVLAGLYAAEIPYAMAIFDHDVRFLAVNDRWIQDYGLANQQIEGQHFYDVMPDAARRWQGVIDSCLETREVISAIDTFARRDGQAVRMRWSLKPWGEDASQPSGVVMTTEILDADQRQPDLSTVQQLALASALGPMAMIEGNRRLAYGNAAFAEMLGLDDTTDLVGADFLPLVQDRSVLRQAVRGLRKDSRWYGYVDITVQDGRSVHLRVAANIVRDHQGRRLGVMLSCTDLTEQKQAEEALSVSRRQLASLMDNLPGGFAFRCKHNAFFSMEIISRGCRDLLGYTPDSLVDNLDVDYASLIHPEDLAEVRQNVLNAVTGRRPFRVNYRVIARDGQTKWVMQQGTPIYNKFDEIEALEGITVDITERIEANRGLEQQKERAEQYLEVASSIMLALDRQGRVSRLNRKGTEVTGYTEAELVGRNWLDAMIAPELVGKMRDLINKLAYGEELSAYQEVETLSRTGETLLIGWELTPITDVAGSVTGILVSGVNLTDQREAERQLLQAQKMQAVGELTGGMAHDFNNLLMAVQGNLEFLRSGIEGDAKQEKYLDTAMQAVGRGTDLTRRLLAFSRKQLLQPEPTAINDLVSDMLELIRRSIGPSIDVSADLDAAVGKALVDPALLENALLNLSINARDAMPQGGSLRIESGMTTQASGFGGQDVVLQPGDYIMIAVHDTGTGMPPDVLERVFEPFYSTKETGKGTGLGLAMVYGFIKQSGGHIEIKSTVGEGTGVYLYLPVGEGAAPVNNAVPDTDEPLRGGEETILVVEDDPPVRDVIVGVLRQWGYDVKEAPNAFVAKQLIRDGLRPEMLLTDIIQPQGSNGIELADATVQYDPDCAILLMSGFSNELLDLAENNALPYPLLTKPFSHEDLVRKVRFILDDRVETNLPGSGRL